MLRNTRHVSRDIRSSTPRRRQSPARILPPAGGVLAIYVTCGVRDTCHIRAKCFTYTAIHATFYAIYVTCEADEQTTTCAHTAPCTSPMPQYTSRATRYTWPFTKNTGKLPRWPIGLTQRSCFRPKRVPDVHSACRLLIVSLFRGSSRFESLIFITPFQEESCM